MVDATDDVVTSLLDLGQVPLAELRSLNQPILTDVLRRVVEEAKSSVDAIAGFQAAI